MNYVCYSERCVLIPQVMSTALAIGRRASKDNVHREVSMESSLRGARWSARRPLSWLALGKASTLRYLNIAADLIHLRDRLISPVLSVIPRVVLWELRTLQSQRSTQTSFLLEFREPPSHRWCSRGCRRYVWPVTRAIQLHWDEIDTIFQGSVSRHWSLCSHSNVMAHENAPSDEPALHRL